MFLAKLVTFVVSSGGIITALHVVATVNEGSKGVVRGLLKSLIANVILDMNDGNRVASPFLVGTPGGMLAKVLGVAPVTWVMFEAGVVHRRDYSHF